MTARRVLVVEDEFLIAANIQMELEDAGYEVIGPIGQAAQALEIMQATEIDFAVLDINLLGESSYPIADQLLSRNIGFVFLTGNDESHLPARFSSAPLLSKPIDFAALRQTIACSAI